MDDIVDENLLRRGKLSWPKLEGIGVTAVQDLLLLEQSCFDILKIYFGQHPCYQRLIDKARYWISHCILGQAHDCLKLPFEQFTWDNYAKKALSAGSYFIGVPLNFAMILTGYDNDKILEANNLMQECAYLVQVQNDFLDVYGEIELTGKSGEDIQTGKCTWLFITAWDASDENQKMILRSHYGKNDERDVKIVRNLFDELNMIEAYRTFKQNMHNSVLKTIKESTTTIPKQVFLEWHMASLYKDPIEINI